LRIIRNDKQKDNLAKVFWDICWMEWRCSNGLLTLGFLAFGLVVLIGFVIVLTDKGLKWKKK